MHSRKIPKQVLIPKIIGAAILIAMIFTIMFSTSSCNKAIVDAQYQFDYAVINYGKDQVWVVGIEKWTDYEDGDQLQIWGTDDNIYLVSAQNCVLVKGEPRVIASADQN